MTETTHYATDENLEGVYIPKSHQFERDINTDGHKISRNDSLQFKKDSNIHYLAESMEYLLETEEGKKEFENILKNFLNSQKERLEILDKYGKGENETIYQGDRRIEENKADHRIAHNFGGYIADLSTDFILTKPVTITYDGSEDDQGTNDIVDVEEINKIINADTLNYELGYDCAVYGRAFEYHYREQGKNDDLVVRIDPTEIFVIRNKTVNKKVIGAVLCPIFNQSLELTIISDKNIYSYEPTDEANPVLRLKGNGKKVNSYGRVPVVEWWNGRYRKGDFEPQIPSIDAYDSAQSDTANYMTDLNDALLVLTGDFKLSKEKIRDMKDVNIIALETGMTTNGGQTSSDAKYIYKQYDVQGTEAYKDRILNDIHLLSRVPKITDESFGTQSGIALMYKLFGFKQLGKKKARYFSKALKERYSIIEEMRKNNGGSPINAQAITYTFHENLPQDLWAEIKQYIDAGGEISQETLRENSSFTTNTKESERLDKELNSKKGYSLEEMAFIQAQNKTNLES